MNNKQEKEPITNTGGSSQDAWGSIYGLLSTEFLYVHAGGFLVSGTKL